MVEKKVYSPWAYTDNEEDKYKMNGTVYRELLGKYKVTRNTTIWNKEKKCEEEINLDEYDVVIKYMGSGYAHARYKVIKNTPNLHNDELALICDNGNLCFGYSMRGGEICVHTD